MKMKQWLPLLLAGLMTFSVIGLAGCDDKTETPDESGSGQVTPPPADQDKDDDGDGNKDTPTTPADKWNNESVWLSKDPLVPTEAAKLPTQRDANKRTDNVSVHDPSVFHDPAANKSPTYYAFGTHFAVASSYDLIEWEQEAGDNDWQVLYGNSASSKYYGWPAALDSTLDIVKPGSDVKTTWAPDVEYYNGTYYMYYSITKAFGSSESVIGRVEAKSPLGPYSNNTVIISSVGASGNHPNCIDSELFYDKEGKLWMVYGSFFGGVYIKELYNEGENWGLPKVEEGWGDLLWLNGYEAGVEGPYVFYNATTDYYYLMTSEGDLNTVYNMRVARSKNPNGPYTDITGNDVATSAGKGNKIAGNYTFSAGSGYAAMGHNSVIKDKDGRYFVVYHTRYKTGNSVTAPHNLYVSQLYFNEEGWPVMAPNAYVGEKAGVVEASALVGEIEFVEHTVQTGSKTNILWASSVKYSLTADGKVMQGTAEAGSWTLKQGFYVEITLDGVTYKGVVVPGWNMYSKAKASYSITAVSSEGRSLWGVQF